MMFVVCTNFQCYRPLGTFIRLYRVQYSMSCAPKLSCHSENLLEHNRKNWVGMRGNRDCVHLQVINLERERWPSTLFVELGGQGTWFAKDTEPRLDTPGTWKRFGEEPRQVPGKGAMGAKVMGFRSPACRRGAQGQAGKGRGALWWAWGSCLVRGVVLITREAAAMDEHEPRVKNG
jgi:hypothetical protein